VSGSVSLTTPPQPINNNVSPAVVDTRFDPDLNTLLPYNIINLSTLQPFPLAKKENREQSGCSRSFLAGIKS